MKVFAYSDKKLNIICPACYTDKTFEFTEPPKEGFEFRCSKCNELIVVEINRRAFYRKELSIPIYYSLKDFDSIIEEGVKSGWIRNISKGGIGIEISSLKYDEEYEKIGNVLTLFFNIPPYYNQIRAKGEIVRVSTEKKFKIFLGIKFLDISENSKQLISFFLRPE
jgi:c-di-GMP-binding flagellar brake protein YcgR